MSVVEVTAEEMEQAIENARTAVFRDPPWVPNARAFLALLTERDQLSAEAAALRRQVEERGDVVRVDVPDKAECVWIANEAQRITGRSIWPDTVDAVLRVVRSRLVPATPPPDVVTVPREYLEMLQSAANRFCSSCRDNNASCSMTARHFGGTGCGAWKLDGTRINALRSGEAGRGVG